MTLGFPRGRDPAFSRHPIMARISEACRLVDVAWPHLEGDVQARAVRAAPQKRWWGVEFYQNRHPVRNRRRRAPRTRDRRLAGELDLID